MTDRTASRSDARKRRSGEIVRDLIADLPPIPTPTPLKLGDRVTVRHRDTGFTFTVARPDQEPDMPAKDRHDELVALLTEIRDRLPEPTEVKVAPFDPDVAARNLEALKHAASKPMSEHGECCEPAPADDLPGEPVEPGDLRAGDRVEFTWQGDERITCALVSDLGGDVLVSDAPHSKGYLPNVVYRGKWDVGITDVRLIERAPREDEDRDEADDSGAGVSDSATRSQALAWRKMTQHPSVVNVRPGGRGSYLDNVLDRLTELRQAEVERDALRKRLNALRADLSPGGLTWTKYAALRRDDERAAKVEQR